MGARCDGFVVEGDVVHPEGVEDECSHELRVGRATDGLEHRPGEVAALVGVVISAAAVMPFVTENKWK